LDATVQEVAREMAENDVGFVPTVDGQAGRPGR
jgi:hypothetical protein